MLRIVLTIILPLLLPTLVYLAYVGLSRRRRVSADGTAPSSWVADTPWAVLIGSGILLMSALLMGLTLTRGHNTDEVYIPAHRTPDGQYVPARSVPKDQLPAQ